MAQGLVLSSGKGSAVEAGYDGGAVQIHWLPAQRIAVIADHVERSFVMPLLAFRFADVMQQGCSQQAGAGGAAIDRRLPSGGEKAIVKLKSQAGNALGMWKVGIEAVRPELHAAGGKGLNLLALRQCRAPNLPERFFAIHSCPVALDALSALGEDALVPAVA